MASSYRKIALNKRVLVNLRSGQGLEGVLWDERGPLIVLKDVRLHEHGNPAPVDGEVIIDRANIAFTQVIS